MCAEKREIEKRERERERERECELSEKAPWFPLERAEASNSFMPCVRTISCCCFPHLLTLLSSHELTSSRELFFLARSLALLSSHESSYPLTNCFSLLARSPLLSSHKLTLTFVPSHELLLFSSLSSHELTFVSSHELTFL